MLHLTYSNRTEALLGRMADHIRDGWEREGRRGIWEPTLIVVPNPHLKEWVRVEVARELGVAANLRFTYLNGLWRELLKADRSRILRSNTLRIGLLGAFTDPSFMSQPDLGPVRHYLADDPKGLKRLQLATELARVFEEYQYSRPEWIRAWREGKGIPRLEAPEATWQRKLWMKAVGWLDATGEEHLTLDEALRQPGFAGSGLPRTVHAFGLSHVAQVYHEVYARIGRLPEVDLRIYALNPCAEFWEDLLTEDESRGRADRPHRVDARMGRELLLGEGTDPEDTDLDLYRLTQEGPEALQRWGRPGRENVRLLNEVADCDFEPAFVAPEGRSLLERIQSDILHFEEPSAHGAQGDGSVRFLSCPTARREAEVVATEIWRLMDLHTGTDHPLSFSDFAVIIPPAQQGPYLAHLQAAFEETHRIPWTHGEGASPVMQQTLEAASLLLELPTSGLTRAAVLRVLASPALARRFGAMDPEAWSRWCEAVGIVRGGDREDWTGTYLDTEALHWDQGLKRLALGAFMGEGSEVSSERGRLAPHPTSELESTGTFLTFARGLLADASRLGSANLELRAWIPELESYLVKWLEGGDEASVRSVDRLRKHLRSLTEDHPEGMEQPTMGFEMVRSLVQEALASLQGEQPVNLSRGVVVSGYTPMRAIPFRVVFLMGLGEGVFPTKDQRNPLDLRTHRRLPGDVGQTEKEKYLFLETLLCTREHLLLSYVGMDELSGEPLEPSGLFKEFRHLVEAYRPQETARAGGPDPLLEVHPLRRFDPVYFPEWFPEATGAGDLRCHAPIAHAEARARWLRQSLDRGTPLVWPSALGKFPLSPSTRSLLEAWLGSPGGGSGTKASEAVLRLTLSDLRRWIECPLTGSAAIRLGLRQEELSDRSMVEDEPFESDFLSLWSLQRETAWASIRRSVPVEEAYQEGLRRRQDRAEAPFGLFAHLEMMQNLDPIQAWVTHLSVQTGRPEFWRFGGGTTRHGQADHLEPALSLSVPLGDQCLRVELSGELNPQWGGSVLLESGAPPSPAEMDGVRRKALGAYLDHLMLACTDPTHGEHQARFVYQRSKKGRQEEILRFHAFTPEEARGILVHWVSELLTGDHDVLLPIEAVLKYWGSGRLTPETVRQFVDEGMESFQQGQVAFSAQRGPVPEPERYDPPEDPEAIARARYGNFLDQVCMGVE